MEMEAETLKQQEMEMETEKQHFERYCKQYDKHYSEEEKKARLQYFKKTLAEIEEINQRPSSAVFGLTDFSDWSPKELADFSADLLPDEFYAAAHADDEVSHEAIASPSSPSVSSDVNWIDGGVVSPPSITKQRGPYCWCHTAVNCLESQIKKQSIEETGVMEKKKLSVQQLIDCVQSNTSIACFEHAVKEGIHTSDNYPYFGPPPQPCQCKTLLKPRTFLSEVQHPLMHLEEGEIKPKLKEGPLYVTVGSDPLLYKYNGGIMDTCTCSSARENHAMLLVAATRESGRKIWIFKNSWGVRWGEGGFLKMLRGVKLCRIGQFIHHCGKILDTKARSSATTKKSSKGMGMGAKTMPKVVPKTKFVGCCCLFHRHHRYNVVASL